jgi:hypothetical protein
MAEQKSFTSILRVVNDYDYDYYEDDDNNGGEILYLYHLLGIRFEKIIKTYRDETDGCDDDVLGFCM